VKKTLNGNLGPDAEIVTNENGGRQSKVEFACHLLDGPAILELAKVLQYGATRYERDNWRLISQEDHINHALVHLFAYLSGDEQDDHLEHAFCRLMMALARKIRPDYLGAADPVSISGVV
jgi:hypothetical protein